jgi:predicted nucleotidyltransferase component of viral defense system
MTPPRYSTPLAFKQALEQHLRNALVPGANLARERQMLIFSRFLARIFRIFGRQVLLKGGMVLELRLARARTTKDIDLRLTGSPSEILNRMQEAGQLDLGDALTFEVRADANRPDIRAEGMKYDGSRYRVEARLAGKIYGQPFGVDVGFADPILGKPDVVRAPDSLAFAGIVPAKIRLYPIESHIAEKLHAYTLPRTRPNTRVKDLPDLAFLAQIREIQGVLLREAIEKTFSFRETHPVPPRLPVPPASWGEVYARMAEDDELPWRSLPELESAVRGFLDPVLGGSSGTWNPALWRWEGL